MYIINMKQLILKKNSSNDFINSEEAINAFWIQEKIYNLTGIQRERKRFIVLYDPTNTFKEYEKINGSLNIKEKKLYNIEIKLIFINGYKIIKLKNGTIE